ncbi:MAG TPA: hypothetical protein VJ875_21330 [Pyrinomonadaceae bacterium]|nr:hypothetical protein [Pyrinomonadaceae bacterium]
MVPVRVVEIVPALLPVMVPVTVVEIVPVLVVEMVPVEVVEMVPVFAKLVAERLMTSTAAQAMGLKFFIVLLLVTENVRGNLVGSEVSPAEHFLWAGR